MGGLNTSVGLQQFCTDHEKQKAIAERMLRTAIQKGLYGQALGQLKVTLVHLVMLEDRFVFGGLGKAPSAQALIEAARRLSQAQESVNEAMPALGEAFVKRASGLCQASHCVPSILNFFLLRDELPSTL